VKIKKKKKLAFFMITGIKKKKSSVLYDNWYSFKHKLIGFVCLAHSFASGVDFPAYILFFFLKIS
jgi:hypothetical protein